MVASLNSKQMLVQMMEKEKLSGTMDRLLTQVACSRSHSWPRRRAAPVQGTAPCFDYIIAELNLLQCPASHFSVLGLVKGTTAWSMR